jgi:hypothetical protein
LLRDEEDTLDFDSFEVTQDDLQSLNSLPPYPSVLVEQLSASSDNCEDVMAALQGYQTCLHNKEDTENYNLAMREELTQSKLATKLHNCFHHTFQEWEELTLSIQRYEKDNPFSVPTKIIREAILGRARRMVTLRDDLILLKEGMRGYLQALDNRTYVFIKLARPLRM